MAESTESPLSFDQTQVSHLSLITALRCPDFSLTLPFLLNLWGGRRDKPGQSLLPRLYPSDCKTLILLKCLYTKLKLISGLFTKTEKTRSWNQRPKAKQLGPMIYSTCFNGDARASQMEVTVLNLAPQLLT